MPYSSIKDLPPSTKSLTTKQKQKFMEVFNAMAAEGMKEEDIFPIAMNQAKTRTKKAISKATIDSVEKDDKGNLVYRGTKFPGYNKPIRSNRDGKQGMVLAKKGDEIKVVHFGDPSMEDNYSAEANDAYYARHGEESDVFSAKYWSNKWLWPKGNLKGKGPKEFYSLKKGKDSLIEITKFNEEQMIAIEPLYCKPMDSDAHDQGMTEEEIRKMVDNINTNINKISGNIGHVFNTDGFYFVKAWVNECECMIGSEFVPEGQPIIKVQFTDETLWSMRKTGQLQGLSIGALGVIVENEE